MTNVPSTAKTLAELAVGVPGAGRRTLLAAMPDLAEARLPENFRLCVLDAERMDSPAQIALLDELAADPASEVVFALNKADRITGPRTVITRTLALLRERGFRQPTLYPTCAAAARLFGLPAWDTSLSAEDLLAQGNFYYRYSPGENSLSAFAVTTPPSIRMGSREVTAEQLRLAMTNTGVPALAAALAEKRLPELEMQNVKCKMQNEGSGIRDQGSGDETVGAAIGRPFEEPASDEAVGSDALIAPVIAGGDDAAAEQRQEASGDASLPGMENEPVPDEAVGAAIGRPLEEPASDEAVGSDALIAPVIAGGDDAAAEQRQEASGDASLPGMENEPVPDEAVGAAIGRPPEDPAPAGEPAPAEADASRDGTLPSAPTDAAEPAAEEPGPEEVLAELMELAGMTEEAPEMQNAECKMQNEASGIRDQGSGDEAAEVGSAGNLPAEAEGSDHAAGTILDRPPEEPSPVVEPAAEEAAAAEAAPSDQLKELLELAKTANCAELLELARCVPGVKAPDEQRDQALDVLHDAYQTRQVEELDALTQGAEELDIDALHTLVDQIVSGPYTVQTRTPYAARLNNRIDELQSAALAELCAGVEEADAQTLAEIRAALEKTDCAEVLKTEHYRRIEARQEALDLEALDRVTAGAEQMNEKELRALAVTLEAGNWNQKYVTGYRHRINLLREAVVYREVREEMAELNDMERREVLALRERIAEKGLPARFTANAAAQIDEKLYRLDMLRLMALNNDLDRLDFDGIDELRAVVARGEYCDRARQEYLDRLLTREKALILENTSARAELTRQLIAQHKLRMSDFVLSTSSKDYQERLEAFWGGSGLEQPRDIPVFLFDNASDYAMTATRFYYKSGRDLAFVPIDNVDHFQVMRQHLTLNLQIVGKDNSYRLTDAKISRGGSERTLEFLNDCVRRWAEPGPPTGRGLVAEYRLPKLDAADYTAPVEPELPQAKTAAELFRAAYEAAKLREGNVVRSEDESSMQRLAKLRGNFGLPETTPIVWYESASRLGPVKEGAAIGPRAVYLKEGKLAVRSIPIGEIFEIRPVGSKRVAVSSLHNETLTLEVSDDMAPLLADYVRTIQLGDWLRDAEGKA